MAALDPMEITVTVVPTFIMALTADTGETIVTIHLDGRVEVNPAFEVDEAARAFWNAVREVARLFPL